MGRAGRFGALIGALAVAWSGTASASGPGETSPWYLDQFGGPKPDLERVYAGRLGVVMARSPRPQLFIAWRLLHGEEVGRTAGAALSVPCCTQATPEPTPGAAPVGVDAWLAARKIVPGAKPSPFFLSTERRGPNYTSIPTCFPDAFDTAAATLAARAAAHGAASPEVAEWLAAQDAVFDACSDDKAVMPPAPAASAPAWLKADRAYQEAAFALYNGYPDQAADRFAAIARDPSSLWRPTALYLRARALEHAAIMQKTPQAFARARAAIAELQAAPAGTFGRSRTRDMLRVLAFRDQPQRVLAELQAELSRPEPPADVAVAFRDLSQLDDQGVGRPEALDWMATLSPPARARAAKPLPGEPYEATQARLRAAALVHAQARWRETHDPAWLLAALSLTDPGAPGADALAADAARVPQTSPAWLSLTYHRVRLTLATARQAETRAQLGAILARTDLSISDRNIFTAERLQVAADPAEFARLALRRRLCAAGPADGCVRQLWLSDTYQTPGVFDGMGDKGSEGLGEDARAVIDRLPLAQRIALSRDPSLPVQLQLDVALTSYARAVQLQDDGAVDQLAGDLARKLPQLQGDWRRIMAAHPGPDKRFAEYLVMAKIPGLRTDLVNYTRPEGSVAQFQRYWTDWIITPPGRTAGAVSPPSLADYQQDGVGASIKSPDVATDLSCLGECGDGAAPLRLPDFAQAQAALAARERTRFVSFEQTYGQPKPPMPPGGVAVWDQMLDYLQAHPADPRAPEALYWLVRVGRFGGSHEHSGARAFRMLHARYPKSTWAARTPYYYD